MLAGVCNDLTLQFPRGASPAGAIFAATRDNIRARPKSFYSNMLTLYSDESRADSDLPVGMDRRTYVHYLGYVFEAIWGRVFGGAAAISLRAAAPAALVATDWTVQNHDCPMYHAVQAKALGLDMAAGPWGMPQEPCRLPSGCKPEFDTTKYDQFGKPTGDWLG